VIWPAIVLTGVGSYILRVVPLVVLPKVTVPPAVERGIRHAGIAAITALLVSSVTHRVDAGDLLPTLLAVAVGLALAVRGAAMLRVVTIGGLTYLALLVVSAAV
jgi:branched-subunit amino acid transport protein